MSEKLYSPDEEEIQDAVIFMNNCSAKDLVEGWNRISEEWELDSVISLHRLLCGSGRINDLINEFKSA
jgi:hypothetical protein